MHPYLKHLLADIAAAHRDDTAFKQTKSMSFEEEMDEIEKWVEGEDAPHTFGYYCGLEAASFPPASQLTINEMKQVMAAFGQMMFSWNIGIDLPSALPVPTAYAMTIDTLNMKTSIVNSGCITFDFCTGYAPDCIFKEYCPCLKIWNDSPDETDDTEALQKDSPF